MFSSEYSETASSSNSIPDIAPKSLTILTRWCAVFSSRQPVASPQVSVSPFAFRQIRSSAGEKLLPLYSLLSMICLQTSRIVGVKVPESLPLTTKVWDLPV